MFHKALVLFFVIVQSLTASSQPGHNNYKLTIINKSANHVVTCLIQAIDRRDTVQAGGKSTISLELGDEMVSFYLDLVVIDPTNGTTSSYKMIRVLNTQGSKEIVITPEGKMLYELTLEEKVIASKEGWYRTKNFWKLDSVINVNKENAAGAELIYMSICNNDVPKDTIQKYYNMLSAEIRLSRFATRITDYLGARDKLIVGKVLDNFELPDTTGKIIQLKDIKSNYVLLDFWFSRCGPCLASFPEIKDLYTKTKRSKLAVIGISTDSKSDHELWLQTIEKNEMTWINLKDAKYKVAKSLAINNYPTRVLLDKDRKIIMLDTDNSQDDFFKRVEKLVAK